MPYLSGHSIAKLSQCDDRLISLCNAVIVYFDFLVVCGYRGEAAQNEAYSKGLSDFKFPFSKHNQLPSLAVDLAPCPLNWKDAERFKELGYFILGYAAANKLKIRWGGDFSQNYDDNDDHWFDLPHYELMI